MDKVGLTSSMKALSGASTLALLVSTSRLEKEAVAFSCPLAVEVRVVGREGVGEFGTG